MDCSGTGWRGDIGVTIRAPGSPKFEVAFTSFKSALATFLLVVVDGVTVGHQVQASVLAFLQRVVFYVIMRTRTFPFVQLRALQLDLIRFTLQYPPSDLSLLCCRFDWRCTDIDIRLGARVPAIFWFAIALLKPALATPSAVVVDGVAVGHQFQASALAFLNRVVFGVIVGFRMMPPFV